MRRNKKLSIISAIILAVILTLSACTSARSDDTQRFIILQKENSYKIVADSNSYKIVADSVTGICYLIYEFRYYKGAGTGITVLLDRDGKPLLYK